MLGRTLGDKVVVGEGDSAVELTVVSIRPDRIKVRIETWMMLGDVLPVEDDTNVTLVDIDRNKARLGFESPKDVKITRKELLTDACDTAIIKKQVPDA